MTKAIDGWQREALDSRKRREKECAAVNALATIVESWVAGECDEALMLLAFHHVVMDFGSYARKKTLRKALKSSIEKLSQVAPEIFPPGRVLKRMKK